MTTLNARPEAITFAPQQSALIVVDMQNAYASKGVIWIWRGSTSPPRSRSLRTSTPPSAPHGKPACSSSGSRTAGTTSTWRPVAPARPTSKVQRPENDAQKP